jgi:uncharacterized membrane-anchored protein YhcB (DUF1043 family)
MDPIYGLIVLVLGFGAGFSVGRTANAAAKQAKALAQELKTVQAELDRQRQQVNEHFTKTGELVNHMTDSYRAVYDHLAKGARSLCSGDAARITMITPAEKLIGSPVTEPVGGLAAKTARAGVGPAEPRPAVPKPAVSPAEAVATDRPAPPVH